MHCTCEHWNINAGCSRKVHKKWTLFLLILYLCNNVDHATILAEFAKHFLKLSYSCYWNVTIFCVFEEMGSNADVSKSGWLCTASMWKNMENGATSSVKDVNTSTFHISTVLRSLCQMFKRMKYHIYQPRLVPNYIFLHLIHQFFF